MSSCCTEEESSGEVPLAAAEWILVYVLQRRPGPSRDEQVRKCANSDSGGIKGLSGTCLRV